MWVSWTTRKPKHLTIKVGHICSNHGRSLRSNIPRQGISGGKHPQPPTTKPTTFYVRKIHFFCFKTSSYGLYESIYKTNLILPLPLSMWELKKKKKMKLLIFVVDFFFTEALPRLPQWKLRHWN